MTNNTISDERKQQISQDLKPYIERAGSANKASKMIGVSGAYISHIINGKWDPIADETWRKVESHVSAKKGKSWNLAEIKNHKALMQLYADAQDSQEVYGVVADAGGSKSFTAELYATTNTDVIWLECAEFWNQRKFLREILKAMGRKSIGYNTSDMMDDIIEGMYKMERPLLIIDEADKLPDRVLYFFISLYNELKGNCGIVLQATHYLRLRVDKGVERKKKGYEEIRSRLGGKFIQLPDINKKDVQLICEANGVFDELEISRIWNESKGDLRRVKRLVHALRRKEASHA